MPGVGILGLGTYLPPDVRGNDYWPADTAARWMAERAAARAAARTFTPTTDGMARVVAAMRTQIDDPFQGAVERRIVSQGQTAYDLEEAAARDALSRAGVAPAAIDLVLTHTPVPEYLLANSACVLHYRLGLPSACLALQVEAAAYSFLGQLELAHRMIRTGQAHYALLVQSSCVSHLLDYEDYDSPVFGDGAAAVVVGPVADGDGLIAASHRTDGRWPSTLVATVRGGRWYDGGRIVLHLPDPAAMRQVALRTVDLCKEAVDVALADAHMTPADVDFFSIHQGTAWLRRAAQDHVGLSAARSIDTFPHTGYLFAANIPVGLRLAEDDGILRRGHRLVMFGGGTGMVYGATVARWSSG